MTMKVYGGTYDGRNRTIVAAPSKKKAYQSMSSVAYGVGSYSTWDKYTCETGNDEEVRVATSSPMTVFSRDERFSYGPLMQMFRAMEEKS